MQHKKIIKILITIFVPVIFIIFGVLFYTWNIYYNKTNLLKKYVVDNSKEVYILGSIGKKHFSRLNSYSMEDLLSAMDNINPDIVLLTARVDHYKDFGIIDGDIDTCVAYSYCLDKNIPAKLIDWWIIDNTKPDYITAALRDDNIFIKISRTLREISSSARILIITGSDHFYQQTDRFDVAGYKEEEISNIKDYFCNANDSFTYPPLASKIWKDRTYFYAFIFPRLIKENDDLFDSVKSKYINIDHDKCYTSNVKLCKYLNNNILYK